MNIVFGGVDTLFSLLFSWVKAVFTTWEVSFHIPMILALMVVCILLGCSAFISADIAEKRMHKTPLYMVLGFFFPVI